MMKSSRLQKKGSSARENGNESRESNGVRTDLDRLNRHGGGSTLGAGAGARCLARAAGAAGSTSTRAGGGRGSDSSLTGNTGLSHEGGAGSSGLDSRLEGSRTAEATSAGAVGGRLGRVVLVKDPAELLGGVAHAVSTVGASGGILKRCQFLSRTKDSNNLRVEYRRRHRGRHHRHSRTCHRSSQHRRFP